MKISLPSLALIGAFFCAAQVALPVAEAGSLSRGTRGQQSFDFGKTIHSRKPRRSLMMESSSCPYTGDETSYNVLIGDLNLDLSSTSGNYPTIDGKIENGVYYTDSGDYKWKAADGTVSTPLPSSGTGTDEYFNFLTLPMYNAGKNNGACDTTTDNGLGENCQIATAKVAFDCSSRTLCAAAYFIEDWLKNKPNIEADQEVDNSWVKLGGSNTYLATNSIAFSYITLEDDDFWTVGWEGCWIIPSDVEMDATTLNVHFNREGKTVSTGQGNGNRLCIDGDCSLPEDCTDLPTGTSCLADFDGDGSNDEGCCNGAGVCVNSFTTTECPATCTAAKCAEENIAAGRCMEWTCGTDGKCEEQPGPVYDADCEAQGDDCQPYSCSDDGACVSGDPQPDNTPCDMYDGSSGECCAGSCTSIGSCGSCPTDCSFTFTSGTPSFPIDSPIVAQCSIGNVPPPLDDIIATDCDGNTILSQDIESTDSALIQEPEGSPCGSLTRTYQTKTGTTCAAATSTIVEYNIVDSERPIVTAPEDETQECGDSNQGEPTLTATVTDNCGNDIAVTWTGTPIGGNACTTTHKIEWKATDACGNSAEGTSESTQYITVKDTQGPSIEVPGDKTLECGIDENAEGVPRPESFGFATATDACTFTESLSYILSTTDGTSYCDGKSTTITWTALDECGNEGFATQNVVVKDTTSPEFPTVLDNIERECGLDEGASFITPTATDVCQGELLSTLDSVSVYNGDYCSDEGKKATLTWVAGDDCGNLAQKTQLVVVKDKSAPRVKAPANENLQCGVDGPSGNQATGDDDCSSVTITSTVSTANQGNFCQDGEVSTITWTATDECGYFAIADQTIRVYDDLPPAFDESTIPSGKTYQCSDAVCAPEDLAIPATETCAGLPTAEDACDTSAITVDYCDEVVDHDSLPGVKITRTFSAHDVCMQTATTSQIIEVIDDCKFSVNAAFSGESINVDVLVANIDGGINVDVMVNDGTFIGDLRAVFFELSDVDLDTVSFTGTYVTENSKCDSNGVDKLNKDALMKGGGNSVQKFYNCGVELGTPGMSKDDIRMTSFTIMSSLSSITTDNLGEGSSFGIRLTSVGELGGQRGFSSKINGPVECCRHTAPENQAQCTAPETSPPTPSPPSDTPCNAVCSGEETTLFCPDLRRGLRA